MDQFDDTEIGRLLRLKKYEQPPAGYFENFLHEFHRRQRDELLRQPLWRICLERAHDFMFRLNVPSLTSYPAAVTAVLLVAAVVSLRLYQPAETSPRAVAVTPVSKEEPWRLDRPVATRVVSTKSLRDSAGSAQTHRASTQPRYVLDSVPVSYEPTFKF